MPVLEYQTEGSLRASSLFFNRDLSWLEFNRRVLAEAEDSGNPLLERVHFLQIFTTNLDEFFMKRLGRLKKDATNGLGDKSPLDPDSLPPREAIRLIHSKLKPQLDLREDIWFKSLSPELERQGILLLGWSDLGRKDQLYLENYFDQNLFPVLTPLAVDPAHPFPFISNLSTSIGVLLRNPLEPGKQSLFARVKIPGGLTPWIPVGQSFIRLQDVILQFIDRLFPGMEIVEALPFRITRNAEVEKDEEDAHNILHLISEELRERRFAEIVRMEHGPSPGGSVVRYVQRELHLDETDIYENPSDMDFSRLDELYQLPRSDLKFRTWSPVVPARFRNHQASLFEVIRQQDVLVHHPYESFSHSVERFVREACLDPDVLAIKMVLYRTGEDSPLLPYLVRAAELGKQVVVLVELKARFDEERNIRLARTLEKAGVHVVYGLVGLKTHCKVTLVVRKEGDEVRSYVHFGTGNYHSITSHVYTDIGLFTANPAFAHEAHHLFHFLTGRSLKSTYEKLLIAPLELKTKLLTMIAQEEAHAKSKKPAQIVAKMNGLEDRDIINALYSASRAGVKIRLIVRGQCLLRPKVKGLSENIQVISVIGRFLEHSRIFYFQNGHKNEMDGNFFLGSADWMVRNLKSRVEAVIRVEDPQARGMLWDFLNLMLTDKKQSWELQPNGDSIKETQLSDSELVGVQERLMRMYEVTEGVGLYSRLTPKLDAGLNDHLKSKDQKHDSNDTSVSPF